MSATSTPLSAARFIVLDTETTGAEPQKVIELAGLDWTYQRPIEADHFQETFIDPQQKIDPASQAVHHILDEDVAGAPLLEEVAPAWDEWVADSPIVAYNSDFDRKVLSSTPLHGKRWVDAWRAAMHVWYIGQENEDGFKLTSFKQQELRYWLRLPKTSGDAHRAAADIQVTAMLLERVIDAYIECGNEPTLEAFLAWVDGPIQHLTLPIGGGHFAGKTPEQLEEWALKKAFDPSYFLFEGFAKFNVHECLLPEYQRRFGKDPAGFGRNKAAPVAGRGPVVSGPPANNAGYKIRASTDTSAPTESGSSSEGASGASGSRFTRRVNLPS